MNGVSRRNFLGAGGVVALVPIATDAATREQHGAAADPGMSAGTAGSAGAGAPEPYLFFNAAEARFIEAAVERLIPPDEIGPGALEAGVPNYIDRQLGGAWGAGERLYRSGPWQQGTPTQGYQLPFTPAELFRNALRGIDDDLRTRGGTHVRQAARRRAGRLPAVAAERASSDLDGVPAQRLLRVAAGDDDRRLLQRPGLRRQPATWWPGR